MRPCDDVCVTGRTRILLPPASWRRAQLRGHLRITANQHRHLRRTQTRAIESVLSKDVQGTGRGRASVAVRSTFLPVLRKITSENFENRLLFQGASLIEAMRRCPLSNGRLPSKRRTPQLPESRVFYFADFPVSWEETDAGIELSGARLPPNRRPFLPRKRGSGGSVFPLRGCTTGARGCPLEGFA